MFHIHTQICKYACFSKEFYSVIYVYAYLIALGQRENAAADDYVVDEVGCDFFCITAADVANAVLN